MFGKKKKYLEYYFNDDSLNSPEIAEEVVGEFITHAIPRTSCWWSKLKSTIDDGFNSQLDYVRHEHKNGNTNIVSTRATAKQCPAINSILMNSYLIKSPTDIIITIDKDCNFLYNSSNDKIVITSHGHFQFHTAGKGLFNDKMNLKFELPINISTDNIPWVFMQPMYHNNMWFDVAVGSIKGKYTKGQPLFVNVLVDIPKGKPFTYEIKAGEVLAYMWFPERVKLKHTQSKFMDKLFQKNWSSKSMFN